MMNIISVYGVYVGRVPKWAGCICARLGPVQKTYDDLKTVGGLFEVSARVVEALRAPHRIAA